MKEMFGEQGKLILDLLNLTMDWKLYIDSDRKVLLGKPVLKGTRISVEHIIQLLAAGWSEDQILSNYPRITKQHLRAVFLASGSSH